MDSQAALRVQIETIKDAVLRDPITMRMALDSLLVDGACFILLREPVAVLPPKSIYLDNDHNKYLQLVDGVRTAEFEEYEILALRRCDFSGYA